MVRVLPELVRRELLQPRLDFVDVVARREVGAVRDAEDVRVDRDRRLAEGGVEHDVRRLAADARQRFQRFALARHRAAVLLEQLLATAG